LDDATLNKVATLYQIGNKLSDKPNDQILATLKKLNNILTTEIEPKTFSVLSYGKVAETEVGVMVVVKRITPDNSTNKLNVVNFLVPQQFKVIRFFWV